MQFRDLDKMTFISNNYSPVKQEVAPCPYSTHGPPVFLWVGDGVFRGHVRASLKPRFFYSLFFPSMSLSYLSWWALYFCGSLPYSLSSLSLALSDTAKASHIQPTDSLVACVGFQAWCSDCPSQNPWSFLCGADLPVAFSTVFVEGAQLLNNQPQGVLFSLVSKPRLVERSFICCPQEE